MMDWEEIKKMDAHVHLLPEDRLNLYKEYPDDSWASADVNEYLKMMDKYNVEKAVLVPNNDGRTYYEHADETNRWLGEMQKKYPKSSMALRMF